MKRIVALILSLTLLFSLAACGNLAETTSDTGTAQQSSGTTTSQSTASGEKVKIGFICWGYSDAESRTYVRLLDFAGAACGFEPVYATFTDMESIINQTETLVESGCKGIITLLATPTQMDICERSGVYLTQWASEVTDPEVSAYLEKSPYWAGYSYTDNVELGKQMVDELYKAGCRNLLVAGLSAGNAVHDLRIAGIYEQMKKYPDLKLSAEFRDADWRNKISDAITSYVNMYPEIDGIITSGGADGICDAVVQALVNTNNVGKVKYACIDVVDNTAQFLEEGSLTACEGFSCADVVWLAIAMTNKVNGWDAKIPMSIHTMGCVITSLEQYEQFSKYVMGENVQPYSAEEYQSVTYTLNPKASAEDLCALSAASTLEDLTTKAKK